MTIDEFIEQVKKRDMPRNPMAKIETFARELAEGAAHGLWSTEFNSFAVSFEGRRVNTPEVQPIYDYIMARWSDLDNAPTYNLLVQNGFLTYDNPQQYELLYTITKSAFDLLTSAETAKIFISYKRSESSSFALLINHVLRQAGLNPFIDMQLQAGADWRKQLRDTIHQSDYLILLLAPTSEQSKATIQEIEWAMGAGTTIIPIWHRGFSYKKSDWVTVSETVCELVADTHTIRVPEENPLAYNTALTELLNRFGVSG
ncbi:MAG: hypothetical protein Phog2KO_17880 [Phototrophicaceae bacterium]